MYSDTLAGKFSIGILVNIYIDTLLRDNLLDESYKEKLLSFSKDSTRKDLVLDSLADQNNKKNCQLVIKLKILE